MAEGGNKFKFGEDLYSLAFVSYTDVPNQMLNGIPGGKSVEKVWAMTMMFIVAVGQLLMSYTIGLHVKNDLVESRFRPMLTAYEMFVGNNWTVPVSLAASICGEWEDIESHVGIAQGPFSTVQFDGVTYAPNADYPMFYNLKQPTRTWNYGMLGADRSKIEDIMYVIAEGITMNPFTHSGYSVMFIMMITLFSFSILVEFRKISCFMMCLIYLPSEKKVEEEDESGERRLRLTWLSAEARFMGAFVCFMQTISTVIVMLLGMQFLFYTTLKIDLILNGLAILFVLELDNAIFYATVPHLKQEMISELEEVQYSRASGETTVLEIVGPILFFPAGLGLAVALRYYQVIGFRKIFHLASAICLFAGPIPGGNDANFPALMGPVAGFCDSLLGTTCAPSVTPASAATAHGYCVITDQTPATLPTIQMYVEDCFPGSRNPDGTLRLRTAQMAGPGVYKEWGRAVQGLYDSGLWMDGPYQNMMRANCMQMYRKIPPYDILVDPGNGEVMDGAPFMCQRQELFEAVFGPVRDAFMENAKHPEDAKQNKLKTFQAISKVRTLFDREVVEAVDRCNLDASKSHLHFFQSSHGGLRRKRHDEQLELMVDRVGSK